MSPAGREGGAGAAGDGRAAGAGHQDSVVRARARTRDHGRRDVRDRSQQEQVEGALTGLDGGAASRAVWDGEEVVVCGGVMGRRCLGRFRNFP